MNRSNFILATFSALLLCSLPMDAASQSEADFAPSPHTLDVRLIPPVRGGNLTVGEPHFSNAGLLPRVVVEITNDSSRERKLEYEFEWFNAAGVPRQTLHATQSVFLDPHETQTLMSVGQHADGVNARVSISEPRD